MNEHSKSWNHPLTPAGEIDLEIRISDEHSLLSDLGMSIMPGPRNPASQPKTSISRQMHDTSRSIPVPTADAVLVSNVSRLSSLKSFVQTPSPMLLEDQLRDLQELFGFPKGLAAELGETRALFPARFWILDNSGSMLHNDGSVLTPQHQSVTCTRWRELQETVQYHAELAALLQATTHFRLLNDPGVRVGPQEFSIAAGGQSTSTEVADVQDILYKTKPFGSTPLTGHLVEIAAQISEMAPMMWQKGLRAVVIVATDGLPTSPDGETSAEITREFIAAIQRLQTLPVWLVIRLCTDEQAVVEFYNQLDSVLELPLEVLDDHVREAKEIQRFNGWLNYALPLHRCREIGYPHRIFDLLDERALNKDEIREFCELLFGNEHFVSAPDVHADWNGFCHALTAALENESPRWNPLKNKLMPWIDVAHLKRVFRGGFWGMLKRKASQKNSVLRSGIRRKGSF